MKPSVQDIARAFIELADSLPESERAALIDAVITLLHDRGLVREARLFPALVALLWRKREGAVSVTFTGPSPDASEAERIGSVIEKALGRPCMLARLTDRQLIGGAVVRVEDERFDFSVRGALHGLADSLLSFSPNRV